MLLVNQKTQQNNKLPAIPRCLRGVHPSGEDGAGVDNKIWAKNAEKILQNAILKEHSFYLHQNYHFLGYA